MFTKQPKKLMILNILDILEKYTDSEHRLSQKEIEDILRSEYNMEADRKAIRRNLMNLIDFGYNIGYNESVRSTVNSKTGAIEESYVLSDFYLERDITDAELRLLIDTLMFSRYIPYQQCKELIGKLEKLSGKYFRSHIKHIACIPTDKAENKQMFLNIELLDEAIVKNRKVVFYYLEYKTDKKQHIKTYPDGTPHPYCVSPYQIVVREGKYYLICNYDKYDDISNYRLDRITSLKISDEQRKPFSSLKGSNGYRLDLVEYMKEHPYMYSADNIRVVFKISKAMISDVIDIFGTDLQFSNENSENVTVSVYTNELSVLQFAKSFAPDVTVLSPEYLCNRIAQELTEALSNYQKLSEGS